MSTSFIGPRCDTLKAQVSAALVICARRRVKEQSSMSSLRHGAIGVVVIAVWAATGCSGSAQKPPRPTPTSTVTAVGTPDAVGQARQVALTAYTGMWTDYAEAAVTANYLDQRLTHHATGSALEQMVQSLYTLKAKGIVIKGTPGMAPKVVDVAPTANPTAVDIKDCVSGENWLEYMAATGKLRDAIPGGHRIVTARVEKQYNQWLVTNYVVEAEGTC